MQAYLDKVLSLDEYRQAKGELIERKQELKEKLTAAEANRGNWFEPATLLVKASKQALSLTENGSEEQRRDFLRKIGSNLTISDRHLSVLPRQPWQLVVDKGPFAQHNAVPGRHGLDGYERTCVDDKGRVVRGLGARGDERGYIVQNAQNGDSCRGSLYGRALLWENSNCRKRH